GVGEHPVHVLKVVEPRPAQQEALSLDHQRYVAAASSILNRFGDRAPAGASWVSATSVRWPVLVMTCHSRSATGFDEKVITMRPASGAFGSMTVAWMPWASRVAPCTSPGAARLRS